MMTIAVRILLFLLLLSPVTVQANYNDAEIKAAFLVNFGRFVQWPEASTPRTAQELRIGIMGRDPFGPALASFATQTVSGVPIRFLPVSTMKEASSCHILYLSPSLRRRAARILRGLEGKPVLTVSDMKGFLEMGGCIELMTIDRHIRFAVNLKTCQQQHLRPSAHLLELARYVVMPKEEP